MQENLESDEYPNPYGIFGTSIITSLRNVSDVMPAGRKKYVHTIGWNGRVTYKSLVTK